jgi:hypothetical protein
MKISNLMNKIIYIFLLPIILFNSCNYETKNNNIEFYRIPMVCGAVSGIACGSKSKPILLALDGETEIIESRINHSGNILAIIWNETSNTETRKKLSDKIFKRYKIELEKIESTQYEKLLSDFENKKNWYLSKAVDQLSKIEANIIAQRFVDRTNLQTPLSEDKLKKLKEEIIFVLINIFTENDSDKASNSIIKEKKLLEVGSKYLNEEEIKSYKNAVALGITPIENE